MNLLKTGALAALLSALSLTCITPVFAADDYDDYESEYVDPDPWERFNRVSFRFNDTLDRYAVKPVAKGYKAVTPEFFRDGVGNFFHNLQEPMNFLNNSLQGKFNEAGVDVSRFLFNTLLGGLGVVDVATPMGLERNDEDLGQTLGYWGVESGPYLMLPFLGPNTLRDTASKLPENFFNYTYTGYINDIRVRNQLFALETLDLRAGLLDQERLITGDRYTFIRNAFLQNREFKVRDGNVPDEF
ncbi:MlaA family lipoprotein [Halopseudomonas maritima]|uniref:MlaA family lipoprotein n=1 Tax=Halopseudomonas maritima TaxID=2918528 RepID=UPI001EEA2397|nr:VacJ family lipoprotein [Halopseudomonas maritima]UJJ31377.1 VacJ family lipoprotein [Halopseudomonas maritima]